MIVCRPSPRKWSVARYFIARSKWKLPITARKWTLSRASCWILFQRWRRIPRAFHCTRPSPENGWPGKNWGLATGGGTYARPCGSPKRCNRSHPALAQAIGESLRQAGVRGEIVASLHREKPEVRKMVAALGTLYCAGKKIDWNVISPSDAAFVKLPAYPWRKATYWFESRRSRQERLGNDGHVFLNDDQHSPWPAWEVEANDAFFPY